MWGKLDLLKICWMFCVAARNKRKKQRLEEKCQCKLLYSSTWERFWTWRVTVVDIFVTLKVCCYGKEKRIKRDTRQTISKLRKLKKKNKNFSVSIKLESIYSSSFSKDYSQKGKLSAFLSSLSFSFDKAYKNIYLSKIQASEEKSINLGDFPGPSQEKETRVYLT